MEFTLLLIVIALCECILQLIRLIFSKDDDTESTTKDTAEEKGSRYHVYTRDDIFKDKR